MKTIEEHNAERLKEIRNKRGTGIKCPVCGKELCFESDDVLLLGPPQKRLFCYYCGHRDIIFV